MLVYLNNLICLLIIYTRLNLQIIIMVKLSKHF